MKKQEILEMIHGAVIEISPDAAELFEKNVAAKNGEVFLVDLGINSIEYAEIAHILMDKLNIDQSLEAFAHTNRVNDVVDICIDLVKRQVNPKQKFI